MAHPVEKIMPNGHVMVLLDTVVMLPNISLELVIKSVSYRWNQMKSHTKLDEREVLKGLNFIMNSIKFKFHGKFYKQKFGTPIDLIISPMLARIVMDDFGKYIF